MKLIVGLGNPGRQYERTRHNVGFEVIDGLAASVAAGPPREKFHGLLQECRIGHQPVLLLRPLTYMNVSGKSVAAATTFYHLPPDHVLIVCDDFALPRGTLRLRAGGSAGGQNGLKDILRTLGTDAVPRLRLGIGPVPGVINPADFVLGRFTADERVQVDEAVTTACRAAATWATDGLDGAMNRFNTKGGTPSGGKPSGTNPSTDRAPRPRRTERSADDRD